MGRAAPLLCIFALLILQPPQGTLAKCPNWCSRSGVCTGPGDDAFCICEMGYQGDDCATRECDETFAQAHPSAWKGW